MIEVYLRGDYSQIRVFQGNRKKESVYHIKIWIEVNRTVKLNMLEVL